MQHHLRRIILNRRLAVWVLLGFIGSIPPGQAVAQPAAEQKTKTITDIPYTKPADPKRSRRQSLDLYLPVRTSSKPPLLIFVHGGFWRLSDDEYRIGPSLANELVTKGIAVALVRYRLAPANRHPAQAQDVAAAVAYLIREAAKYGYDKKRIFLSGHSSGAHLAALVALDSSYLTAQKADPRALAGVIAISGLYNLYRKTGISQTQRNATEQTFGHNPATLRAASPITHAKQAGPPFLILAGASDFPGFLGDARLFATALRRAGHKNIQQYVVPDRDHFSMIQMTGQVNEIRIFLLAFLKVQPLPQQFAELVNAKRAWVNPPFSTVPFWRHKDLIHSAPIDRRFVEHLLPIYGPNKYELLEWPLERFYYLDLFSYLDAVSRDVGQGQYLIMTNLSGEKQFWKRAEIEPYKPVIVIGIDDEKNLFRLGVFYQGLREYSWKRGPRPPLMARRLGAFVYFLKEPPGRLRPQPQHYGLTIKSFQLAKKDPLAPLRALPKSLREVLTYRNGCIYCHSLRNAGSRSYHILASTGAAHGGFALPLESYPPAVWKAFVFKQREVAKQIGASPNLIEETARQPLYELVTKYRNQQPTSTK